MSLELLHSRLVYPSFQLLGVGEPRCGVGRALCFGNIGPGVAARIQLYPAGPSVSAPPPAGVSHSRLTWRPSAPGIGLAGAEEDRGFRYSLGGGVGGWGGAGCEPTASVPTGFALQIQCYQCEEFQLNNDCSSPEFIVNCTVNVQDMCQKEVMEQSAGKKPVASTPRQPRPGERSWGMGDHCITGKGTDFDLMHIHWLSQIYFYRAGNMKSSKLL